MMFYFAQYNYRQRSFSCGSFFRQSNNTIEVDVGTSEKQQQQKDLDVTCRRERPKILSNGLLGLIGWLYWGFNSTLIAKVI